MHAFNDKVIDNLTNSIYSGILWIYAKVPKHVQTSKTH